MRVVLFYFMTQSSVCFMDIFVVKCFVKRVVRVRKKKRNAFSPTRKEGILKASLVNKTHLRKNRNAKFTIRFLRRPCPLCEEKHWHTSFPSLLTDTQVGERRDIRAVCSQIWRLDVLPKHPEQHSRRRRGQILSRWISEGSGERAAAAVTRSPSRATRADKNCLAGMFRHSDAELPRENGANNENRDGKQERRKVQNELAGLVCLAAIRRESKRDVLQVLQEVERRDSRH